MNNQSQKYYAFFKKSNINFYLDISQHINRFHTKLHENKIKIVVTSDYHNDYNEVKYDFHNSSGVSILMSFKFIEVHSISNVESSTNDNL